ncbi:MAG: phosphoserine phosphatase [Parcubacteria group bacterium]|nr:phosphoserine phosphatase [Parcubacteria group bacterium]
MENSPRRKVALFDICGTLVKVTTIIDFTEQFLLSPRTNPRFSIFKWLSHQSHRIEHRLHLDRPNAYRRHLVNLYKGYTEEELAPLAEAYRDRLLDRKKTAVVEKLRALAASGHEIYLVSAGLDAYLKPFAHALGATLIATTLEKDARGRYTGAVQGVDSIGEGKVVRVRAELPDSAEVDWEESWAFGDSVSDIPILSLVGNVWTVDPEPELAEHARSQQWEIVSSHASVESNA